MGEFVNPVPTTDTAVMPLTADVYEQIRLTVGRLPAEQGGILGGKLTDGIVTHFHFDRQAQTTRGSYTPNHAMLNRLLSCDWNPRGVRMLGFVHSQPRGCTAPSIYDVEYALTILNCNPTLDYLYLPIVQSTGDRCPFAIYAYRVVRNAPVNEACQALRVEVVPPVTAPAPPVWQGAAAIWAADGSAPSPALPELPSPSSDAPNPCPVAADYGGTVGETFSRVADAVDLARLATSRVIVVGVGGAAGFVEDLARCGVGSFVLIDPDTASESNIATQQVYRRDLGKPKVMLVARRVRQINPQASVLAIADSLDNIDDATFARWLRKPIRRWSAEVADYWGLSGMNVPGEVTVRPSRILICGCTDSFAAQARINRLALHFGIPSLCAQLYAEGKGGEVTFTYPGVTPACHRCMLKMRYDAHSAGNVPKVTSHGTPVFSTTRLNALKGFIALALLHYGGSHPRWSQWLESVKNRNLVQIRMDPELDLRVFQRTFAGADSQRIFCDETVWLPQVPRCATASEPACPDCGGTGDLRNCIGTFDDTRTMRDASNT